MRTAGPPSSSRCVTLTLTLTLTLPLTLPLTITLIITLTLALALTLTLTLTLTLKPKVSGGHLGTARALLRAGAPCSDRASQLARDARESKMLALLDTACAAQLGG